MIGYLILAFFVGVFFGILFSTILIIQRRKQLPNPKVTKADLLQRKGW